MSKEKSGGDAVLLEKSDGLAILTLNRPDAYNAIDVEMSEALLAALIDCDEDRDVRAVMITGAGRAFCSGGDIRSMNEELQQGPSAAKFIKLVTATFHTGVATIARMPKPVVMAVNGAAAGGGFSFANSGDLIVAADDATFTMAYSALGVPPDGSSTYRLPRLIGERRAFELFCTNKVLGAAEARDIGLVNEVYPAAEFHARAVEYAARLANSATQALGAGKRLFALSSTTSLETQMEYERQAIAAVSASDDYREAVTAFLGKRKAKFTGR